VRRRAQPLPSPVGLEWARRYSYADWADESEWPHWTWQGTAPEWRGIRAFRRWLDAKAQWSADNGRCINKVLGEPHNSCNSCNLCWIADGRMKAPRDRR
jgi:hypothetical protein